MPKTAYKVTATKCIKIKCEQSIRPTIPCGNRMILFANLKIIIYADFFPSCFPSHPLFPFPTKKPNCNSKREPGYQANNEKHDSATFLAIHITTITTITILLSNNNNDNNNTFNNNRNNNNNDSNINNL